MRIVCNTNRINTLTYGKVYDVIEGTESIGEDGSMIGFVIVDDFENKQFYSAIYFISIDENRDNKLNSILK